MAIRTRHRAEPAQDPAVAHDQVRLDGSPLIRVGARPPLGRYLAQIWHFRHFIIFDSHSRVQTANTSESLGRVWLVMNPILNGLAYFLIFGLLLNTSRGVPNFIGYLIIGVFMFRYITTSVSSGATSIASKQSVVQAFNFPRACIPLAVNVRELFQSVPMFLVMAVLVTTMGDIPLEDAEASPVVLSWKWLVFFPALALTLMLTTGLGMLLARAVSAHTDVKHLITFGTRIWFYASAVFFSVSRFADTPLIIDLMHLNPAFCTLDIIRQAWVYDEWADPMRWVVLGGWAVGALVIGFIVFWQGEETYGRDR
ncbi:ABC transporter permease [Nesterenkonia sp. F]|uniref:ABC transporter permease n=1 Tax=Nesterenkonia sp. F TaxID=795955 RepID=UPI000255C801|nr:ABC transporter permease [Nesterenkonia sp. F]